MISPIKIAIAGVGNCASALLQGIEFYKTKDLNDAPGVTYPHIGPYKITDILPVAAFDIDKRKVGYPLHKAVFAKPNCTTTFHKDLPEYNVTVSMGPILDSVASHMVNYPEDERFVVSDTDSVDIAEVLKSSGAEVLVCYLPVGSEQAVRHYATACLETGVALVNCVPVFIASHPEWGAEFKKRGIPIVGDDIKSQFGATLLHRTIAKALSDRGTTIDRTYQLNTGGNTDFLNMLEQPRLKSKRISKTESVQSQLKSPLEQKNIHIGPSDYVSWQKDNKVCFVRVEYRGWGNLPMHVEARLSVEDSPNSAGVAIDAIRCVKLALMKGIGGPLEAISAFTMKHPSLQMTDTEAKEAVSHFIKRMSLSAVCKI